MKLTQDIRKKECEYNPVTVNKNDRCFKAAGNKWTAIHGTWNPVSADHSRVCPRAQLGTFLHDKSFLF